MIFFTSDTHFGHTNIIKYCNRPFVSSEEMDATMIQNWNAVIKPEDTIYHLGDFAFKKPDFAHTILTQLNGHKILIRGNHDKSLGRMVQLGFNEAWDKLLIDFCGEQIWLSHYPYPYIEYDPYIEDHDDPDAQHIVMPSVGQPKDDFHTWMFCGHVHTAWKTKTYKSRKNGMINVGVDQWEFKPISQDELKVFLDQIKREKNNS